MGTSSLICATAGAQSSVQDSSTSAASRTTQVTQVMHDGRKAYRMSDGRSEAIIVPEIGRVMSYGFVGGPKPVVEQSAKAVQGR
jgi:hypothetical protein